MGNVARASWFDVEMDGVMPVVSPVRVGSENEQQLRQSAALVADIVAEEKLAARGGGGTVAGGGAGAGAGSSVGEHPVVLGGFGPGGAVALWALLSVKPKGAGSRPDALILANAWAPPSLTRPKNMTSLQARMLTNAEEMVTCADVCRRMLTYTCACCRACACCC